MTMAIICSAAAFILLIGLWVTRENEGSEVKADEKESIWSFLRCQRETELPTEEMTETEEEIEEEAPDAEMEADAEADAEAETEAEAFTETEVELVAETEATPAEPKLEEEVVAEALTPTEIEEEAKEEELPTEETDADAETEEELAAETEATTTPEAEAPGAELYALLNGQSLHFLNRKQLEELAAEATETLDRFLVKRDAKSVSKVDLTIRTTNFEFKENSDGRFLAGRSFGGRQDVELELPADVEGLRSLIGKSKPMRCWAKLRDGGIRVVSERMIAETAEKWLTIGLDAKEVLLAEASEITGVLAVVRFADGSSDNLAIPVEVYNWYKNPTPKKGGKHKGSND